ncbi:acetate kinase [Clostridium sp. 19966]|uniref:acetate/propionate family kinase n=1 Tax=Clostridium sp. 19966 TaxID=2768166 RepID=UPI0028DEAEB6|nr:acetate kinase [Clostridium sp. 19966]MDT8716457.1 acetate kinase [Clostridium sp. 19966]
MKVLVVNCGSSSLKYQLFNMDNESVLAKGLVERIGIEGSILTQKVSGRENFVIQKPLKDHKEAIETVIQALVDVEHGVIKDTNEIGAVGHRVVHGGEKYAKSVLIDEAVMKALEECIKIAPLHNPPNLIGIEACKAIMPGVPMVAVFDTAFHANMPEEAYLYALPYELYEQKKIRRYGFHGTSHKYVSKLAADLLKKDVKDTKIITCHLGNGASVAAVKGGISVDTSMGFTPLEGLAMGTRSGDLDPAIIKYLLDDGYSIKEVDEILNKKSGIFGISGVSSDFRDVRSAAEQGNPRAQLAIKIFTYRVKKYIGAYAAAMGGVDAVVFTAGLGENASIIRKYSCEGLEFLGISIDEVKNEAPGEDCDISVKDAKVKVFVIPTDEELMIARDTLNLSK